MTIKKRAIFVCATVLLSIIAVNSYSQSNQKIHWGIFGGPNFAKQSGDGVRITSDDGKQWDQNTRFGFHAGISSEISLAQNLYLQPELYFSQGGVKTPTINGESAKLKTDYVNLPVLLKYKFSNSQFGLFLGPQYGLLVDAKYEQKSQGDKMSIDIKDSCEKSEISGVFGAEYYFPAGIGFSMQYQLGFTNVYKSNANGTTDAKNRIFSISVGYRF